MAEVVGRRQRDRIKTIGHGSTVLVEVLEHLSVAIPGPSYDHGSFMICFEAFCEEEIRAQHAPLVDAVLGALALTLQTPPPLTRLCDAMYLTEASGKPIYSYSPRAGGLTLIAQEHWSDEMSSALAARLNAIRRNHNLRRSLCLLVKSLEQTEDRLRSFTTAWNALELLIAESFQSYIEDLVRISANRASAAVFFENASKGDYGFSIERKFNLVSHLLSVGFEGDDRRLFHKARTARNDLIHGAHVDDEQLPVEQLRSLLLRFIEAYAERPSPDGLKLLANTAEGED